MKNNFSSKELQVEEWIKKGVDDELNAWSILKHKDGTPSGVCFLSQQMAEKYLKAFLVWRRQRFPKIHPIDKLVQYCQEIDSTFLKLKSDAIFLTEFYTETRYPADYSEFSWQDAEQSFAAAKRIKTFVLRKIKK